MHPVQTDAVPSARRRDMLLAGATAVAAAALPAMAAAAGTPARSASSA
ncbi:alpha/beta hydrolase, partial [Burkholderia contaminans]